jgi:hypothetical protein
MGSRHFLGHSTRYYSRLQMEPDPEIPHNPLSQWLANFLLNVAFDIL